MRGAAIEDSFERATAAGTTGGGARDQPSSKARTASASGIGATAP